MFTVCHPGSDYFALVSYYLHSLLFSCAVFIHTGTYPSPKACASLVVYKDSLILFGGWSHPTPYTFHQVRLKSMPASKLAT